MKASRVILLVLAAALGATLVVVAQGPKSGGSETVARPKKGTSGTPNTPAEPADQSKIPSQYKKNKELPEGVATYTTDAVTVTVDVSVLDNKGHFIPNLPEENFRLLDDNDPQKITTISTG